MSNKDDFLLVLKEEFAPRLREVGFKGSGHNFKRINDDIINIVNIQVSKYGGSYAVNLGLHLSFLPVCWSTEIPDLKKLKESDCEFRTRLTPKLNYDYWWKYEGMLCNPAKNARHLIETYFKHGEESFQSFGKLDDFIEIFTIERIKKDKYSGSFKDKNLVRGALTMARIYEHLEQIENAKIFAKIGYENIGKATLLKPEFEKILDIAE